MSCEFEGIKWLKRKNILKTGELKWNWQEIFCIKSFHILNRVGTYVLVLFFILKWLI